MILRDRIRISAPVETVWKVLTDLNRLPEWLPKCHAVLIEPGTTPHSGMRFPLERKWRNDTRVSEVTLTEYSPPNVLAWREVMQEARQEVTVKETFRLIRKGDRCQIRHAIDFSGSGIPLWIQILMKTIHVLGKPAGKTGLMHLRELAERST